MPDHLPERKLPADFRCGGSLGKPQRYVICDWLPGVEKSAPCPGCPDCQPNLPEPECPFCDYQGPSQELYRDHGIFIIRPLNPVAEGHLLVIPERHVEHFADDPALTADVVKVAAEWTTDGDWNLLTSKGAAATQTVPHLHVHLVPRREDDGLQLPWDTSALQSQRRLTEEAEQALAEADRLFGLYEGAQEALANAWDEVPFGSESDRGLSEEIRSLVTRTESLQRQVSGYREALEEMVEVADAVKRAAPADQETIRPGVHFLLLQQLAGKANQARSLLTSSSTPEQGNG